MRFGKIPVVLIALFAIVLFVFYSTLFVYFVQDDFFLLYISKIVNFGDFFRFFIPLSNNVWYRPLSSQVFFGLGQIVFGLQPFFYHVVVMLTHLSTVFFLYWYCSEENKNRTVGLLAATFYGVHSMHVISLAWLASYSFVLGPLLLILTFYAYIKEKYVISVLLYLAALLTTEVNIIFILWLISYHWWNKKVVIRKWLAPFLGISFFIVWLRLGLFPSQQSSDLYSFSFSLQFLSTVKFYLLRFVGFPMFIDEMPTVLKLFTYGLGVIVVSVLGVGAYLMYKQKKSDLCNIGFWLSICVIGFIPFVFLPNHIAPYYLSFALLGGAWIFSKMLFVSKVLFKKSYQLPFLIVISVIFILWQYIGVVWTEQTHWIFRRAALAHDLVELQNFDYPPGSEEYFSLGAGSAAKVFK